MGKTFPKLCVTIVSTPQSPPWVPFSWGCWSSPGHHPRPCSLCHSHSSWIISCIPTASATVPTAMTRALHIQPTLPFELKTHVHSCLLDVPTRKSHWHFPFDTPTPEFIFLPKPDSSSHLSYKPEKELDSFLHPLCHQLIYLLIQGFPKQWWIRTIWEP